MTRREYIAGLSANLERMFLGERIPYMQPVGCVGGLDVDVTWRDVLAASYVTSAFVRGEAMEALQQRG